MDIYICCKDNTGMAKVHLALSEKYNLEQYLIEPISMNTVGYINLVL